MRDLGCAQGSIQRGEIHEPAKFIDGAVARTFANLPSGTFLSYMTPASMTTQRQGKAGRDD
jgi:hypothetical protein